MKKYIQKSLSLAAIIIFLITFISYFCFDYSEEMKLLFSITIMSFLFMGIHYLVLYIFGDWLFLEIIVEYILVGIIVILAGFLNKWFNQSNWWMSLIYITPVFLIAYALEIAHIKTEMNTINKKLKQKENQNENT